MTSFHTDPQVFNQLSLSVTKKLKPDNKLFFCPLIASRMLIWFSPLKKYARDPVALLLRIDVEKSWFQILFFSISIFFSLLIILVSCPERELLTSIILFKIAHIGPAEFAAAVSALEIG